VAEEEKVDAVNNTSCGWALSVGREETEAEVEHDIGLMLRRAMARRRCYDVLERRRGHGDRGWWCSRTMRQAALQAHGKAGRGVTGGDRGELVGAVAV
jgi:hypothetical protein